MEALIACILTLSNSRPVGNNAGDGKRIVNQNGPDGFYVVGLGAWGETSASRFTIWVDPAAGIDVAQLPLAFSLDEAAEVLSADRIGTAR